MLPSNFPSFLDAAKEMAPSGAPLFLDEIHEPPEWQRLVRALLDCGYLLSVTGSVTADFPVISESGVPNSYVNYSAASSNAISPIGTACGRTDTS